MRRRVRAEVLSHYGPACQCCGEVRDAFLSIDHVNGDGHKDVDSKGRRVAGAQLYARLLRDAFPEGYRTLCMNCNFCLGHRGYCPHGQLIQRTKKRPFTVEATDESRAAQRLSNQWKWLCYKMEVLSHYGHGCACCGETQQEFLTIEHPNQTGAAHRKEINGDAKDGRNFLVWLRKNGYPEGYQILCMNCNFATRKGEPCPHVA